MGALPTAIFERARKMEKLPAAPPSHEWDIKHVRIATDAPGVALLSWNVDTDEINMDNGGFDVWGETKVTGARAQGGFSAGLPIASRPVDYSGAGHCSDHLRSVCVARRLRRRSVRGCAL
jgi:hypothetical protein